MKKTHALLLATAFTLLVVLIPPSSFSVPYSSTKDEGCEECHSDFKAFTILIDAPTEVPDNYDFYYKVIVKNQEEHTVTDLGAYIDLSNASYLETPGEVEPYHNELSGSVNYGETVTYYFPVEKGASQARIVLSGDEGLLGINNLDLVVTGSEGGSWESSNSGPNEEVILESGDLSAGGVGAYAVEVEHAQGGPSISFTLTITVEYGNNIRYLHGPDLAPGEEYTFIWQLRSIAKGDNTISAIVTGTAYHVHEEPEYTDSAEYTYEDSSRLKVGDKLVYQSPTEELQISPPVLLLERITGLLSGALLILSIAFCGYLRPLCSRINKTVGGAAKRCKWHCRISQALLLISFIHGILMPFSPHVNTLKGLVLGTSAFTILGILGLIGWFQKPLKTRWGDKKWCRIHQILTILVVLIVIIHAVTEGSDFSWLR